MSPAVRAFVALPLPEPWRDWLADFVKRESQGLDSRLSWTRPGNWHVTLRFLGDVEERRIASIKQALAPLSFAPVPLAAAHAGFFPDTRRPRVFWAGLDEPGARACAALAAAVDAALAPLGFSPEDRPFRAHATLARIRRQGRDDFAALAARVGPGGSAPPRAEARELVLYASTLGPQGPRYSRLLTVPAG